MYCNTITPLNIGWDPPVHFVHGLADEHDVTDAPHVVVNQRRAVRHPCDRVSTVSPRQPEFGLVEEHLHVLQHDPARRVPHSLIELLAFTWKNSPF